MSTQTITNPQMKGGLGESFNTLGFSGTNLKDGASTDEVKFLMGKGSYLGDLDALEGMAKRKLLTKTMAMMLIEIAKEEHDWKWHSRFELTLKCQDEKIEADGRSYTDFYCKERCCLICLANRKAEKVNLYLPTVEGMPDPHFLTITAQSVKKEELRKRVEETLEAIRTIIARHKKRAERKTEEKIYGLWSLESNFNPVALTYNPHIHMILPSLKAAQAFRRDWMEYWQLKGVKISRKGQKYRAVKKDVKKDLIEIVKYGSKIFTEPDIAERMQYNLPKKPSFIHVRALYNILVAMDGYDLFNTFGFELKNRKKPCKYTKKATKYTDYMYDLADADWVNEEKGLKLTKYKIPNDLQALLDSRVDSTLE